LAGVTRGLLVRALDADRGEAEVGELLGDALVAGVRGLAETAVELDEGGQVLRVRQAAAAGASAEAGRGLARDAAEHDVLVLPVAGRSGAAEEEDVVVREMRRRWRDRKVEGLVALVHGMKIA